MPEKNLQVLLKAMKPCLYAEEYVFCSVSEDVLKHLEAKPLCLFREQEGVSIVLEKESADKAMLLYDGIWSLITCTINSDLNAVGFLAAMCAVLAEVGISVNAVSAFFHDHLFVPKKKLVKQFLF